MRMACDFCRNYIELWCMQSWEAMVWALTSEDCFFNEQSLHDAPSVFICRLVKICRTC